MANLPATHSTALAREFLTAHNTHATVGDLPSARDFGGAALDLDDAYAIEAQLAELRATDGVHVLGRKVGFANKAMWRALKIDTLLWASMYSDTVRNANDGHAELSVAHLRSPKIEPEIVFKLRQPARVGGDPETLDAATMLASVEWFALGFEIIDCLFPDWKFQPVDFVASGGFHAGLVIGERHPVTASEIPALVEQLAQFTLRLFKNEEIAQEGAGKNCLRSPALCLIELAAATSRRGVPLQSGEIISSGTLTDAQPIAPGQTWRVEVEGIPLPPLTLKLVTAP